MDKTGATSEDYVNFDTQQNKGRVKKLEDLVLKMTTKIAKLETKINSLEIEVNFLKNYRKYQINNGDI